MLLQMLLSHSFFKAENYSIVCIHTYIHTNTHTYTHTASSLSIHQSEHFVFVRVLTIVNSAEMSIGVHVTF